MNTNMDAPSLSHSTTASHPQSRRPFHPHFPFKASCLIADGFLAACSAACAKKLFVLAVMYVVLRRPLLVQSVVWQATLCLSSLVV